jgi:hypothetical protein
MSRNTGRPIASLSLDLDNQWSYMKTHGDPGWEDYPSYLDTLLPPLLDLLDELELRITFFVVGQDAALPANTVQLMQIVEGGHEIGNHSFNHEPWIQFYTEGKLRDEILRADEIIAKVTGRKPVGFRGPGFSWHPGLIKHLARNGYTYDATILPTFIGPFARRYYFKKTKLSEQDTQFRKQLYGGFREALHPVKPFVFRNEEDDSLLEIPVTTVPGFKTPFHFSYLLYLARISSALMRTYLKFALAMCRLTHTSPSFLLHPLDFLDTTQVPQLAFFPAMDLNREDKIELFGYVVKVLGKDYDLVDMGTHAAALKETRGLKSIRV